MDPSGFEPLTSTLQMWHSNQLNYGPEKYGHGRDRTSDLIFIRDALFHWATCPNSKLIHLRRINFEPILIYRNLCLAKNSVHSGTTNRTITFCSPSWTTLSFHLDFLWIFHCLLFSAFDTITNYLVIHRFLVRRRRTINYYQNLL